jgi:hypothetical protein
VEYENEGRPLEKTSRRAGGGGSKWENKGKGEWRGVAKLNVDPFDILRLRLPFLG